MNEITETRLKLTDGALFPIFMMGSMSGNIENTKKELTKQKIVEIIKNGNKIYLSDISEMLEINIEDAIKYISELKSEGKIQTR